MWRDIVLANKDSIITVMDQIMEDFKAVRCAIENGDEEYLMDTRVHGMRATILASY